MPLLGHAAMLLSFDIAPEAIAEHDRWHTHEHLPERLAIPGFLRGTRWVAGAAQETTAAADVPRYMVLYEVESLATLSSPAYLERLNHPSAWTTRVMPHYRGMRRGLCTVRASHGHGCGHAAALIRFRPPAPQASAAVPFDRWLAHEALAALPSAPGLGSAHWLAGAATAAMTHEQRLRGSADAGVDAAIVVTGYDAAAVAEAAAKLGRVELPQRGAGDASVGLYRIDYSLAANELQAAANRPR